MNLKEEIEKADLNSAFKKEDHGIQSHHCMANRWGKKWKILKETGIPDHLTCLLRNLYAGQEATVKTGHGTMDLFQIGKGVLQDYILTPYLFILCRVYHAECQIG